MSREFILQEIKRTAIVNDGKPFGKERFEKETGIKISEWYGKYWTKWSDALIEAGYAPNTFIRAYSEDYLVEKLIDVIRDIKKFPTEGDLRIKAFNDKTFPSHNIFDRWSKREKAQKIIDYCRDNEQFSDIIEICRTFCKRTLNMFI